MNTHHHSADPATRETDLLGLLSAAAARHPSIVQVSSLGPEDMVITDLIARHRLPIGLITLDTGRLPAQTYTQLAHVQRRYEPLGLAIQVVFPGAVAVEFYVRRFGIDGFYDSVAARKACCEARKVQPLARALKGRSAWITGLRRAQSAERAQVALIDTETVSSAGSGVVTREKISPLADWSHDEVWDYLRRHDVPVNALHAQGYPSIGCAPCTRAVGDDEDPRAGRWWWEAATVKASGLHVGADVLLNRGHAPAALEETLS